MTDAVTLAQAKSHLRVTQSSEDSTIQIYISAASQTIRNFLNLRLLPGEGQPSPNIPADIQAAALLIIGGMYETRSDKIIGERLAENPSLMNLLMPYRARMGV